MGNSRINIFTTGGTIDKIYFDAKSEFQVGTLLPPQEYRTKQIRNLLLRSVGFVSNVFRLWFACPLFGVRLSGFAQAADIEPFA